MSILEELDSDGIIDALTFFPALATNAAIEQKLNSSIKSSIAKKTSDIKKKNKTKFLSLLIDRYFDLETYQVTELELLDWATQFIIRKNIINQLNFSDQTHFNPNKRDYNIQSSIFKLLQKPIVDYKQYPLMFLNHPSSVNDLTLSELHTISEQYIEDGTFDLINTAFKQVDDENGVTENVFNLLTSPVNNLIHNNNPLITTTIDLSVNDTQLKKDFAEYLSLKRKELSIEPSTSKPFKPGKINSLIDNRVLQYLDLKILDLYINKKDTLKQNQFAKYIFPDTDDKHTNIDTTEKIRKSTIPSAKEMLEEKTIVSILTECKQHHPEIYSTGIK